MKRRSTGLLLTTLLIAGIISGCGQTTADTGADTASVSDNGSEADSASDNSAFDDSDIVIDPSAGISPFYKDPSSVSDNASDAGDNDQSASGNNTSDGDTTGDTSSIVAAVYNNSSDDADAPDDSVPSDPERVSHDLYVATYGLDSNDGTIDYPLRTIQQALDMISPGYTVYIRNGIYSGKNIFTNSGSDDGGYITVTAMPEERVIVTLGYGESGAIFDINGQSNILIRELQIGYSRSDWVYGVYMHGGENNIIVTDNDICNLATYNRSGRGTGGAYGVLMYGTGPDEASAISNVSIDNNRVYTIETGNCEAIAASGNCDNINISSNIVYDIMNIGIDLYGNADYSTNPSLDQPRNCTIDNNTIYNCVSDNYAVAGVYIDGARDTEVKNNVIYENMYGVVVCSEHRDDNYPVTNILIDDNEIHDNHDCGIAMGGYDTTLSGLVQNSEIIGNRLYNNGVAANEGWNGEISIEKCSDITVSDNEVIAHNYNYPVISSQTSQDFIHNVTFTNNMYLTSNPDNIRFRFAGVTYKGLSNWNKGVGATDTNTRGESGS